MSTITKERVAQFIKNPLDNGLTRGEQMELARIALASLEAEPYGYVHKAAYEQAGSCGLSSDHEAYRDSSTHIAVYTAPPAPVSVPDDVSGPLAHAYKELTPTFMRNHIDVFERYGIYPDGSAGIQAMRIALDGMNRRAAMLQGAEKTESPTTMQTAPSLYSSPKNAESASSNSPVIPDGWVVAPKEPTEVMFNAGKLAAGPTKQPDTASLVYKAMIEAAPDYKVRNEITYNGYLIQEEVKDSIRKKIHSSPDTEKSVLWVMKHRGIYREPEIWIFGVTFNCVGDGDSSISAKAQVNIVNSTFINCDLPKGDIQFINCTLPAQWEGKVNAIDCVFKAAPQQEVK